jgi:hypothetical protein
MSFSILSSNKGLCGGRSPFGKQALEIEVDLKPLKGLYRNMELRLLPVQAGLNLAAWVILYL